MRLSTEEYNKEVKTGGLHAHVVQSTLLYTSAQSCSILRHSSQQVLKIRFAPVVFMSESRIHEAVDIINEDM